MNVTQVAQAADTVFKAVAEQVNSTDANATETLLDDAKTSLVSVAALVGVAGGVALAAAATTAYLKSSQPAEGEAPRVSEGDNAVQSEAEAPAEVQTAVITPFAVQQSKIQESRSGVFMTNHATADVVRAESKVNNALIAENKAAHIAYGKEVIAQLKAVN